nr:MAG TPA: hypothetical protein [Caudoviricetes sp.]
MSRNNCEVKILKTDSLVDGRYVCVMSFPKNG